MRPDPRAVFVEHAAAEFVAQGFPPMPARVLIALTMSDEGRLTSEELQEQLEVSAAAVSGAVRYLQTVGFLQRATEPGGRRQVYRIPESTPWYTATLNRTDAMRRIVEVMSEGRTALPADSPAHERLEEIIGFFEFLQHGMPALLEEWKQLRRSDQTEP